ncbi:MULTISPECIES: tyrosine-type recombinase/integrase [Mesorhizobium]|uniref:tyrosine-type recombinase/integrase n=1 Tax=Mesorhizobium sp. WSM3859 TaxID=2029402 RepID=UPI001FD99F70|nr:MULTISPECIES: tyrosine-type recombinase/integrase [Mesorhizobium]
MSLPVRIDTVAGLRHSEALDLRRNDVDLDQGILTIRETKFGKSRLVPLHATTVAGLCRARRRASRRAS